MNFCYVTRRFLPVSQLGNLVMLCGIVGVVGCTSESQAPRYQVSGKVTYAGQPVPSGLVKFEPDLDNGGTGPGSYAPIRNGSFCTEEGLCAGPMKVRICGFDGAPHEGYDYMEALSEETRLFKEYPAQAVVKNEDTVIDFEIPEL